MTNIKPEDGLTHDWDRSSPDEWHPDTNPADASALLGVIALIIVGAAALIAVFSGIEAAPIVIPGLLLGAIVYVFSLTRNVDR